MTDIQPNKTGRRRRAIKRLKKNHRALNTDFETLTAGQRWTLVQRTLLNIILILLFLIKEDDGEEGS